MKEKRGVKIGDCYKDSKGITKEQFLKEIEKITPEYSYTISSNIGYLNNRTIMGKMIEDFFRRYRISLSTVALFSVYTYGCSIIIDLKES